MNAIPHSEPQGSPELPPSLLSKMIAAPIWLLWKAIPESGKAKPKKVPFYVSGVPRNGACDTPEDRAQLVSYEYAVQALAASGVAYAGLAIALGPDGRGGCWQGVDLDDIVAAGVSDIADLWTRGSCAGFGYVEQSPGGKGIHIIGYGRSFKSLGSNSSGIEAYAGGRFFTFTGNAIVADSPCQCVDLADYVEQALAPRHGAARAQQPKGSALVLVPITDVTKRDLRSALASMPSDDRELWVNMGMALAELGNNGRALWLEWSQTSEKYEPNYAARTWDGFNPAATGYQAVFAEAQRQGWLNPSSNAAHPDRATTQPTTSSARTLIGRSLGGVSARAIDWLWTGWIPQGYITILAGESGAGKSTVLADIAARVTTGAPWPGEDSTARREPARVLWLGSEDSIEEMTVPRLMACGANLNNVVEIQGAEQQGKRNTFSMQDDLEEVSKWLASAQVDGLPFDMLVIDPVTSYLHGQHMRKVDTNDAGQLRSILEPWLVLAQRHNIAIVCVTHFSKDAGRSMMNRVLGSQAFAATCRSLVAVIEPPANEDCEPGPFEKAMIQVKGNLPEHPGGAWKFSTEKVPVGLDPSSGKQIYATKPDWESLDSAITSKTVVGSKRGPKSQHGAPFGIWLQAKFMGLPLDHWEPLHNVKGASISDCGISESWWNKHSPEYLEKRNIDGVWKCRPLANNCGQGVETW